MSKGLNPYVGLDDVKPLVVQPSQDRIEELLRATRRCLISLCHWFGMPRVEALHPKLDPCRRSPKRN